MSNEEFEDIFGNVPFENIKKIQKYIKDNYVSLGLYNKEKEKNKKIENYCRGDLAFERRLIRTNQEPDMFNQGRFYTSQNIINIICEKAEKEEE